MRGFKKFLEFLRQCVELYIPIASFVVMFLVFVLQIFCRYVLRQPLEWAYELTVSCYLWMVVLGACYAMRSRSHVAFTLFYDKLSVKGKAVTAFLGNALIAFALSYSFWPSVEFIGFMSRQTTSVLKIGMNWVYLPYIPFMVLIILYMLFDMVKEARVFLGMASAEEISRMLAENKSETQEAIEEARKEGQA